MATGLSRPNYINGVDLTNSNIAIRLTVNRDVTTGDVVDTTTTHTTITLQQLVDILGAAISTAAVDAVADKPEVAALTSASVAADIVAALQA